MSMFNKRIPTLDSYKSPGEIDFLVDICSSSIDNTVIVACGFLTNQVTDHVSVSNSLEYFIFSLFVFKHEYCIELYNSVVKFSPCN